MATVNTTEYLQIDDLPLCTPAWFIEDISTILQGPGTRGDDLVAASRAGKIARRRTLDSREIAIPMTVIGFVDSDGNPHADPRAGLIANLDELKQNLSPRYTTTAGTRTLLWDNGSTIYRTAEVHVNPAIDVSAIGPHAARVVITAVIPGGVWREAAGSTYVFEQISTPSTTATFTLTNYGTGEIQDAVVYFAGLATWGSANTITTSAPGAPAPGSGSTGDYYYDETAGVIYGPRGAGGSWPGPFEVQFGSGTPAAENIARADYWVGFVAGVPTTVYGPRTVANPNAGSFKIENLSYDATGGVYVYYNAAITSPLVISCGTYNATEGATDVSGIVENAGTPLWLPLLPGANTIRVTLTSNATDSAVNVLYQSVYL